MTFEPATVRCWHYILQVNIGADYTVFNSMMMMMATMMMMMINDCGRAGGYGEEQEDCSTGSCEEVEYWKLDIDYFISQ